MKNTTSFMFLLITTLAPINGWAWGNYVGDNNLGVCVAISWMCFFGCLCAKSYREKG